MKTLRRSLEMAVSYVVLTSILFNLIDSYEPDLINNQVTSKQQIYEESVPTTTDKPFDQTETLSYDRQVLDTRCLALCDDLLTTKRNHFSLRDLYRVVCNSIECQLCNLGCKYGSSNSTCDNSCRNATTAHSNLFSVCEESCLFRREINNETQVFHETNNHTGAFKPEVICQRHDGPNIIVELFWPVKLDILNKSLGFVIQVQNKNLSRLKQWMDAGMTKSNMVSIALEPDEAYKFRITVITSDGVIGQFLSEWFITMPVELNLLPPQNFKVHNQFGFTSKAAEIEISWDSPKNKPCFFNIYGLAINATSSSYQERSITTPEELLKPIKLTGLSYSTWYELRVSSALHGANIESAYSTFKLLTKSCLELNNYNFSICGPNPPDNVQIEKSSNITTCLVSWESPKNTTNSNQVLSYKIRISEDYYKGANNLVPEEFFVDGNVSSIEISLPKLQYTSYQVSVFAVSEGGISEPASKVITLKNVEDSAKLAQNWVVWVSCVIGFILTSLGIVTIVYRIRKTKFGKSFRFLHYKQQEVNSWISPLKKKLLNECPYHMDLNMICLKEVLGSGAFGIVHKGTAMIRGVEETVAVKMLKESATSEAESNLLEEIEMLKFLGHHPHIVTLRGYAISSPQIALLVEFCPLGDLKKYLDTLREKEFKAHASDQDESGFCSGSGRTNSLLSLYSNNGSSKVTFESVIKSSSNENVESGLNMGSEYLTSIQRQKSDVSNRSGISTDSGNGQELSLSQKGSGSAVFNNYYDSFSTIESKWQQNMKRFVSYARQIAIGMDFLAKNKVIHRDLAARNILLYSIDQVKITDFGLSRDIYECGVYSKTSNGMLPVKWMALESIISQIYTSKSDVWAFGILLWEIISLGGTPYPGLSNREVLPLLQAGYRMEKPSYLPDEIYAIMTSCWMEDQVNRPKFADLILSLEKILEGFEPYCVAV